PPKSLRRKNEDWYPCSSGVCPVGLDGPCAERGPKRHQVPTRHCLQRSSDRTAADRGGLRRPDEARRIRIPCEVLGRVEGPAALASRYGSDRGGTFRHALLRVGRQMG